MVWQNRDKDTGMAKHVLLIEDEPNIIEAISFILRQEGFRVSTHSDGIRAVAEINDQSPDLVILDVMLPGRSGFDILRELRGQDATQALPVLMLSAKGQSKDKLAAQSLGVSQYMTKPFSNSEMLDVVRRLLA